MLIKVIYSRGSSHVPSAGSFFPFHRRPHPRKSQFCGNSNKSFMPRHRGEAQNQGLGWIGSTERGFPSWELPPRDYEGSWCPIHGGALDFPGSLRCCPLTPDRAPAWQGMLWSSLQGFPGTRLISLDGKRVINPWRAHRSIYSQKE